ncbi:MAG: hypothetical protein ACKOPI_08515 [bacterium]
MKQSKAYAAVAVLAATAVFVVSACGEKNEQVSTVVDQVKSTATEAIGGGAADCSQGALTTAVQAWSKAQGDGQQASLPSGSDSFKCADGWAVAFPNVGSGPGEITVTAVFQAEGPVWVPQDRSKVCGKKSPVPKSLYQDACQTN